MRCHHSSVVDAFVTRCCLLPEQHHKWLWQRYQALLLFVKPVRVSSSRETSASLSAGHCTPTVWCTDFNKDRQRSLFLSSKAHRAMSGCITPCVSVRRGALNCEKSAMLACDKSISLKELLCWDSRLDAVLWRRYNYLCCSTGCMLWGKLGTCSSRSYTSTAGDRLRHEKHRSRRAGTQRPRKILEVTQSAAKLGTMPPANKVSAPPGRLSQTPCHCPDLCCRARSALCRGLPGSACRRSWIRPSGSSRTCWTCWTPSGQGSRCPRSPQIGPRTRWHPCLLLEDKQGTSSWAVLPTNVWKGRHQRQPGGGCSESGVFLGTASKFQWICAAS